MANGKKSFYMYAEWIETFEALDDEHAGKLVKHLFRYVNDLNPETDNKIVKLLFIPIKQMLKRDLKKWESICERNAKNGKLGGRPKTQKNPNKANGYFENPTEPKKADKDKDKDKDINKIDKSISVDWDKLIYAFNKMTGKTTRVVNDKTKQQIKARLREGYTKEDIVNAIFNCSSDTYHKETNHKYLTLEFITRADKLEKYSTLKTIK